ncbi:hypothetical protein Bca101_044665 [Brassica carinata]
MTANRFLCEVCNKGFNREQNLQLHGRVHNLPWKLKQKSEKEVRRKVYICPEPTCVHHDPSHALGDLTGIKKHYYRKHCEKKWECKKCPKSYALLSDWKTHSKICGTKVYGCDCGTTFSRRNNYISHKTFCIALKQEPARNPTVSFPEMGAASGGSGVRHGFYGGAASAVGKQDFYARAVSSLDRHGFYGGAASALPHNQFSNNSNTGFNPPATGYNLNHSSSKNFEDLVPQPTKPNHRPTNFRMQYSSNQGLLAHNDPTLRSQHNLISLGDLINNNNSPNPGYFQNNTKNSNQAIFTHGAANNNPEMGTASGGSGVRHGVYGGAASALPHNQFGNNSNTGFHPPAASYNLNHSSSKTFEELVPQPTKPNPGPTNFRMQYSSNQGLLAHNDPTLRSQHNLISLGDMINNNDSPNPGYFQNNTKNTNQAIFTHGAANNNPSGLVRGLPSSSLSWSSVIANGFGQNQNGNLQGRMSSLPVTKNQQGWSSSNILGPHFGNNLSMGGSNMRPFDFPGVKGGIVINGRNPAPLDTEMKYSYPIHPFGHN